MGKMNDQELRTIIEDEISSSMGYHSSELASERRAAMDRYLGKDYGNEVDGRSHAHTRDVLETVEWVMPQLMKIFTAGNVTVEFEPQGRDDEGQAKQEMDYINYVFDHDNNGFLNLYSFFKDALLQKTGIIKHYWEDKEDISTETLSGLSDDEMVLIAMDPEVKVTHHTERECATDPQITPQGVMPGQPYLEHDITIKRTKKYGKEVIEPVPPEEFLISRSARSPDVQAATFVAHRARKTETELLEMGIDAKVVSMLPSYSEQSSNQEETARRHLADERQGDNRKDAMREIEVFECYVYVDWDGDGKAELRKVIKAGSEILDNEACDWIPFAAVTPIILTHKFYGYSLADLMLDLQEIKTSVFRNVLDNFYLINNRRVAVNEAVTIEDILVSRPGGVIRTDGLTPPMQHIHELAVTPLGADGFTMMEYIDTLRKDRTGVDDNVTGLSPDVLKEANVGTVMASMSNAMGKIELIARIFAETGVKWLFQGIHRDLINHHDKSRQVRLSGKWTGVDPRNWRVREDMRVKVGLGTNSPREKAMYLNAILQLQEKALQAGLPITTPDLLYNTVTDLAELAGFRDTSRFWLDPSSDQAKQIGEQKAKSAEAQKKADMQAQIMMAEAQQKPTTEAAKQIELLKAEQKAIDADDRRDIESMKIAAEQAQSDKDYNVEIDKLKLQLSENERKITEMMQKHEQVMTKIEAQHLVDVPGSAI